MARLLQALVEHCQIELERTEKGWRLTGKGPLGVFGLLSLVFVLAYWGIMSWMT